MIDELKLPECHWGTIKGIYPFFLPLCVPDGRGGTRYLTEDFSFSHRLAQIGVTPMADTTIKLFHYKKYGFSYEDLQPRRGAPTTRSISNTRRRATGPENGSGARPRKHRSPDRGAPSTAPPATIGPGVSRDEKQGRLSAQTTGPCVAPGKSS